MECLKSDRTLFKCKIDLVMHCIRHKDNYHLTCTMLNDSHQCEMCYAYCKLVLPI